MFSGTDRVQTQMPEQEFQRRYANRKLTTEEWEALRKYHGLSCDEKIIAGLFYYWEGIAIGAVRKVRGHPYH